MGEIFFIKGKTFYRFTDYRITDFFLPITVTDFFCHFSVKIGKIR
jgi:hypothetical protein